MSQDFSKHFGDTQNDKQVERLPNVRFSNVALSLVQLFVKHTIKYVGDGLTGGIIPVGSICSGVYEDWCKSEKLPGDGAVVPPAEAQNRIRSELERIAQDVAAYRAEVEASLSEMGGNCLEDQRKRVSVILNQVPGRILASMRRPDDPTGRTIPSGMVLRKADDLAQFFPTRMPRFQPGDRAVPGTDLMLVDLLGVGGFGEVWKAIHERRQHLPPVALKFCTDESAARSLRKEVELLDRVATQGRHPGIVELKYAHLEGESPCLEYEYIEGGDLAGLILELHKAGRASPLQSTQLVGEIATAVGYAHRLQPPIVHRDLKPANILTTQENGKWVVKVADFGIGGIASEATINEWIGEGGKASIREAPTQSIGSCTPMYASPQQQRFGRPDPRDDVYALGVIWYQALMGDVTRQPPRGGSWKRKLAEKGATSEMLYLLESCLEDEPEDRPADAQVLADELSKVLRNAHQPPTPAPARVTPALLPTANPPPIAATVTAVSSSLSTKVGELHCFTGHTMPVNSVAVTHDGRFAASGSDDHTIRLWDISTLQLIRCLEGHTDGVTSVAFSPDGQYILSGSRDATVRLWDANSGVMIRQFRGWWSKHTAEVSSVLFSPDGKRAISGSLDETIRLWDVSTGKHLGALCYQTNAVDDTSPVERLAVFPSGHRILSLKGGRCQEVLVWDAHNLRQVDAEGDLKYAVLHDQSLSIAISPNGKCIGVGYDRNEGVRLYDAGTGLKVKKLVYNTVEDNQYPIPRKIDPSVYCIAFCPASTSLLSGGSDNLVHYFSNLFIDCKDIVVKHCFKGHTSHVTSVTFLSGGRLGLSGSKDHTVRLWGLPT